MILIEGGNRLENEDAYKYREKGKLAILKLLIRKGKIKLDKDHLILNPVNAIEHNQFAIAKYLIEKGDFKINQEVATQLFRSAAQTARVDALKFLLNHDQIKKFFSLTDKDSDNFTLLNYLTGRSAIGDPSPQKRIKMLEWLHKQERIDLKGGQGKKVVFLANENREFEVVLEVFPKVKVEWTNTELNELLHNAIIYGRDELAKWLLENSKIKDTFEITTEVPFGDETYSFLDIFIKPTGFPSINHSGKAVILDYLIQKGKIDLSNKDLSKKIWFTACLEDNPYILQYLLKNNIVKANIKNDKGQNGVIVAILNSYIPALNVVKFLTKQGNININERDNRNQTAYDYALKSKNKEVIDYMTSLKKGKNLKKRTQKGNDVHTDNHGPANDDKLKQETNIGNKGNNNIEEQKQLKGSDHDNQLVQETESNRNDLNEDKSTDFKFIVKVVVLMIAGIGIFVGLPYYFFSKKTKKIVAES